ncbi:MAG: 16S rRNA (guanine(527)-N(7))-methyltransferase RsmG [Xanthomonadales bacterium]|nr:16S rRNA (guanine(527)-N(7))-methyltransferase RsmG [Xanthomonadales bacterium]NIX12363.1 16S rRNA (guanine(527)-N(7))-methyltransferase RsmG [Xanthomonadales bacterium]
MREDAELTELAGGLRALGLPDDAALIDRLVAYAGSLRRWAGSYNLVAPGDLVQLVPRHLLDSLSIHPYLPDGRMLDVGSGAGLPGVPLAIVRPDLAVTVLDSAGKKARFMRHVKRELGLRNLEVEHARVQDLRPDRSFDAVVSRAFSTLGEFARAVRHLAGPGTRLLAMKGKHPARELDDLPPWLETVSVERIEVPDLHAERHLVIMCLSPEAP